MAVQLLHDPANGALPRAFARIQPTPVDFHTHPAGSIDTADRCPRCGRDLNVHVWQSLLTDGEVLDCGVVA